jgi:hypothetical protein
MFYNYHNSRYYPWKHSVSGAGFYFRPQVKSNYLVNILIYYIYNILIYLVLPLYQETSSIFWVQLSRYHLKTETESSLWNAMFKIKVRTMDNVQNCVCTQIADGPLYQTRIRDDAFGGMRIEKRTRSVRRKSVPVKLWVWKMPNEPAWDWTQVEAVRILWLTSWATERPKTEQ